MNPLPLFQQNELTIGAIYDFYHGSCGSFRASSKRVAGR